MLEGIAQFIARGSKRLMTPRLRKFGTMGYWQLAVHQIERRAEHARLLLNVIAQLERLDYWFSMDAAYIELQCSAVSSRGAFHPRGYCHLRHADHIFISHR